MVGVCLFWMAGSCLWKSEVVTSGRVRNGRFRRVRLNPQHSRFGNWSNVSESDCRSRNQDLLHAQDPIRTDHDERTLAFSGVAEQRATPNDLRAGRVRKGEVEVGGFQ